MEIILGELRARRGRQEKKRGERLFFILPTSSPPPPLQVSFVNVIVLSITQGEVEDFSWLGWGRKAVGCRRLLQPHALLDFSEERD